MDISRHALRRSPSTEPPPPAADLPYYELDELTEWQVSAPMPARSRVLDRDVTEALGETSPAADNRPVNGAARDPDRITRPIRARPGDAAANGPHGAAAAPVSQSARPGSGTPHLEPGANGARQDRAAGRRRPGRLAPGEVLCRRYVVEGQVAHYGMGHVYKALDRHRQDAGVAEPWVALKLARHSVGGEGETSALLRQEFLKLSMLRHPNIVDVFDIARDGELEFIVMEWLDGETLADLLACINTRRIALDRALDIVRSTARALAHAHDAGIVHGDVKPSNIFLTRSRGVKVLDFGSTGTATADGERHWATRAYASPAVLDGRAPQAHDDVFALGVTAYCLLSGERPFGELDAREAAEQGLEPPPLPDDALEAWPAVRRALAADAIDRTSDARRFLQELEEAPEAADGAARERRPVLYGAAIATALVGLVWWSVQGIDGLPDPTAATLTAANRALVAGELVEPPGTSALALYSKVLEAEPGNALARDGLEHVAGRLVAEAREALAAGDPAAARAHLVQARQVSPGHPGIALLEDLLAALGQVALLQSRWAASTSPERAEALLERAVALLPDGDRRIARGRDVIAAQRTAARVGELLRAIDERILGERLSVPAGDSALDLLRQARELAPHDPRIPLAADRVLTALLFQTLFAISDGDLEDAGKFLALARGMGIRHVALARAGYELAKAKRAALAAN